MGSRPDLYLDTNGQKYVSLDQDQFHSKNNDINDLHQKVPSLICLTLKNGKISNFLFVYIKEALIKQKTGVDNETIREITRNR